MRSTAGTLAAPFPYFGGKARACSTVWAALGNPANYVEPFSGSAAMLLGRPDVGMIETINDADGFVANFWRAISKDAEAVSREADWPVNEADLFSRHAWLIAQKDPLLDRLHADPDHFDAKIAGRWAWGACSWIGDGWCSGTGPWIHDGERIVDRRALAAVERVPGVNRKLPHLGDAGRGVNRFVGSYSTRGEFILDWFLLLQARMRSVRVACGDWKRVLTTSVTTRHGLTGVFFDPPYEKGAMQYAAGGVGSGMSAEVRDWCSDHGDDPLFRIVLCGHTGEHDALLSRGWGKRYWTARNGYAKDTANAAGETLWCSPGCVTLDARGSGEIALDVA